jgi:hypothetical protein
MEGHNGTQNGRTNEMARSPTGTSLSNYQLIQKFKGKTGEDDDRFLKNVLRYIDQNVLNGKYNSEMEQNMDHVSVVHTHCRSRVREFLKSWTAIGKWNRTWYRKGYDADTGC